MAYSSEIEKLEKRWLENPKGRNFAPLADAYRKAGEVDKAIELCLNGLERHPDYVSAHIVYGRCLMDQKNDVGAEGVFKKVLTLDPENIIALKVLAELADRGGRFGESAEWLTSLLAADPMNDEAREHLRDARSKAAAAPPEEPEPAAMALAEPAPEPAADEPALVMPPPEPPPPPMARASGSARREGTGDGEPGLIDLDALAAAEAPTTAMTQPTFAAEPPLVEHDEVVLQAGSRAQDIETFDGDLGFTSASGRADGLVAEESEPLKPDALAIEGLARTQYEGSGMFRLDAPEGPPPVEDAPGEPEVGPAADLPLIMPDEAVPVRRSSVSMRAPEPEPPRHSRTSGAVPAAVALSDDDGAADGAALSAAEPVMTETMAELYLAQGHREDALRVYRALLAGRPGDPRLAARVRDLEGPTAPPMRTVPAAPPLETASDFLRRVWRGEAEPVPAPVPALEPPARPPAPSLELTGALEAAFAGAPRVSEAVPPPADAPDAPGAPTLPAEDVISLDAVFGDPVGRPAAAEPAAPPPAPEAPAGASGGFSFDDFFGAAPGAPGAPARSPARGGRPSRPQPEDEDLDQFQSWLKGLKT